MSDQLDIVLKVAALEGEIIIYQDKLHSTEQKLRSTVSEMVDAKTQLMIMEDKFNRSQKVVEQLVQLNAHLNAS